VSDDVAGRAEILFLEGYLYDKPKGKAGLRTRRPAVPGRAARRASRCPIPFCVDRHRDDFRRLVKDLDYVIGNEHEWCSLYQTDLSIGAGAGGADAGLVVCTRSGHDVVIVRGEERPWCR
jgi:sugar/nucleoside kinase (ribokinase family)